MEHARVVPVRVRDHSSELAADVSRIVGYRAVEGETWKGPVRSSYRVAAWDARTRNAERRAQAGR